LRTNWTDEPYTGFTTDTLEVGYDETKWAQYYEDHLVYLKHVIDRHIITKQVHTCYHIIHYYDMR
jgi:hypothetical protein